MRPTAILLSISLILIALAVAFEIQNSHGKPGNGSTTTISTGALAIFYIIFSAISNNSSPDSKNRKISIFLFNTYNPKSERGDNGIEEKLDFDWVFKSDHS